MKDQKLVSPVLVERLFLAALIVLAVLLIVNYAFATHLLKSQSEQLDRTKIEAEVGSNDIKTIQSATKKITEDADAFKRAESVVAQSKLYKYQDQIIRDLQGYASHSNLKIGGYSFSSSDTAGSSPSSPPPSPSSSPAAPAANAPVTPTPTGVSSTTVTITLADSVKYIDFLNFLKLIENNVTRMQIVDINLTPDAQSGSKITSPSLSIIVYTR